MSLLLNRLRDLLPESVALAEAIEPAELLDGESISAIAARQKEFALGRSAARVAMRILDQPARAIPMGIDRAPIWPETLTGSISHCEGACLALVGRSHDWAGLGIDIEPFRSLPQDLWDTILLPSERAALSQDAGHKALLIFTIKEAVYKAQYSLTGQLFGFDTLHVTLDGQSYEAQFQNAVGTFATGDVLHGNWVSEMGFTAATCLIPAHGVRR